MIYPLFTGKSYFSSIIRAGMENYLIFQPAKLRATRVKRSS